MEYRYLPCGNQKYTDKSDFYARFILQKQLKDKALWQKFVEVYSTREDAADNGWRGEYFGKMMRGACLTYRYLPDRELYDILQETVLSLLSRQDEWGRLSTYPTSHEFCGWDLWCRKYVLVGCLYFYDVCKDSLLKERILTAMRKHLDYVVERIGEGKTPITETSEWYGGMNASSILEPVVQMYKLTSEPRYLAFAEYLYRMGGCKDGNVIEAVKKGMLPHELPTTKAYETMSYFEGILALYEATGKEEFLSVTEKFADLVFQNEITLIGCAGCHGEHFDHAAVTQANDVKEKTIMQETCVTVTWIRLQERLFRATGKMKYADRVERSVLNALYGAVNLYDEPQFCKEEKRFLTGVPFDSYSPLVEAHRGVGIGGFKRFASGGYYGCCACIGAAGTALYPLSSALFTEKGAAVLFYHSGEITFPFAEGEMTLRAEGSLAEGKMQYVVCQASDVQKELIFRIPSWSKGSEVLLNGERIPFTGDAAVVRRLFQEGDRLMLTFALSAEKHLLNEKVAFTYGPFVLASDQSKDDRFGEKLRLSEPLLLLPIEKGEDEEVRLLLHTEKGDRVLSDYASCGKRWTGKKSRIAVWQKFKS